jgi:hypothetical protein
VITPDAYDRRTDRSLEDAPKQPEQTAERSPLAVHRDPSQPPPVTGAEPNQPTRSIAWVRPSDLPTVVGAPWVRRGIDLQAELTRRARRGPATTARAGRRVTRTAIARPETAAPTKTTREGVEL